MRRREALGQLLNGRRQTVVQLVATSPQSIAPNVLGGLDNLQDSVVGGNVLERDAEFCY